MIDAHKIVYNNLSSEEFDVILGLSFDGDDGATESSLNREGVYTEHYDGHRTIHRAKYNEAFIPRFTLIKKDYGEFDATENRRILSWLTASEKPGWLEVYKDDSNVMEWRVFGCVTSVEQYKLGNGRIVGYEFEIESSHPYAWSRKFIYPDNRITTEEISNNDETNDYLAVSGTESFKMICNTDEYNKLIYPKVIINFGKNKDIYIPFIPKDGTHRRPNADEFMFSNAVYTFQEPNEKTGTLEDKQYVSIVAEGVQERAYVITVPVDSNLTQLRADFPSIKYFHVVDGRSHTIRTIEDGKWKTITRTGAAVKIETIYKFDGETTSKSIEVKNAALGEEITLDGMNKVISVVWYDDKGKKIDDVRVMGEDFNWEWLPLAYGENNITITGNCEVQIQWIEPRKVGSL